MTVPTWGADYIYDYDIGGGAASMSDAFAATPSDDELILLGFATTDETEAEPVWPTGFTSIGACRTKGADWAGYLAYKVASSEGSATYSITPNGGGNFPSVDCALFGFIIENVDTTNPVGNHVIDYLNSANPYGAALDVGTTDHMVLCIVKSMVTGPSTAEFDAAYTVSSDYRMAWGYQTSTTAQVIPHESNQVTLGHLEFKVAINGSGSTGDNAFPEGDAEIDIPFETGYTDGNTLQSHTGWSMYQVSGTVSAYVDEHDDHAPGQVVDMSNVADTFNVYSTALSSDDQWAGLTFFPDTQSNEANKWNKGGVFLRLQASTAGSTMDGYMVRLQRELDDTGTFLKVYRVTDASPTELASSADLEADFGVNYPCRIHARIDGDDITGYVDGVSVVTYDISSDGTKYTTGDYTGIALQRGYASTYSQPFVDDFVAGVLPSGATSHPITATGTATSSGTSATINATRPLAATGTATSSGSAAIELPSVAHPLTATGTSTSSGSADIDATRPLTSTGTATSAGSVALEVTHALAASGTATSTGTADLTATLIAGSTGTATSTGTADLTATLIAESTGTATSTGSVEINVTRPLAATGTSTSSGSVSIGIAGQLFLNNFEGGSDATALTQGSGGNTGGTSGDYFDDVVTTGTSTIVFDDDIQLHGTYTGLYTAVSNAAYTTWKASFAAGDEIYDRRYFRVSALPSSPSNPVIASFRESDDLTVAADVRLLNTGALQLRVPQTARYTTAASTIAINTWYRLETHILDLGTGYLRIQARLYQGANLESADPADSLEIGDWADSWGGGTAGDGSFGTVIHGWLTTPGTTSAMSLDSLGVSETGWLGPAVLSLAASGASTSSGSAAIEIAAVTHPITASGASTSSGTAAIEIDTGILPLAASGASTSSGTATIVAERPLTSIGTGTSTGTADLTATWVMASAGASTSTGSVAIAIPASDVQGSGATTLDDITSNGVGYGTSPPQPDPSRASPFQFQVRQHMIERLADGALKAGAGEQHDRELEDYLGWLYAKVAFRTGRYAPTLVNMAIGSGGNPANYANWTLSNDQLLVGGKVLFGTSGATFPTGTVTMSLPSGYTFDDAVPDNAAVGQATHSDGGVLTDSTIRRQSATTVRVVVPAGMSYAAGDSITYQYTVRIPLVWT